MATKQFVLLVAVVGGIAFGIVLNLYSDASYGATASTLIGIPAEIFLRLLKLVITPIIFTTIVLAIMRGDRAGGIHRSARLSKHISPTLCSSPAWAMDTTRYGRLAS